MHRPVALVTGAGTGLGRMIATGLARENYRILVHYNNSESDAKEVVDEIRAHEGDAVLLKADLSSVEDINKLTDRIRVEIGTLDVLVNNAAQTAFVPFVNLDALDQATWDRILAVNTRAPYLLARGLADLLRKSPAGRVVNISSVAAARPMGSSIAYCVSKAALEMLTGCLALALAPTVTVNSVAPSLMDTRWGRAWGERQFKEFAETAPLRRVPTLEDVVDAVRFFIRNQSITGRTIPVDCGRTLVSASKNSVATAERLILPP